MSLLFLDGVDSYHVIGGALYGPTAPNIGYFISQTNASETQVTIGAGTSANSRAFAIARSRTGYSRVTKQISVLGSKFTLGFAMNAGARDSILKITDVFDVNWPATGFPEIGASQGSVIPILNTWYYWEFEVDKVQKTVKVWLNGYEQFTGTFTADIGDSVEFSWGWTRVGDDPAVLYIDDIYLVDDTNVSGTALTSRLGPIEIATRLPTGNTHTDWAPTPNTKENWRIVSQVPAVQNEYVQSNVLNAYDLYTSTTAITKPVIAVGVAALTAKTDVDQHAISLLVSNGTQIVEGESIDLSTQYTYVQTVFERDAAGQQWTPETATAVNFGIKVK